MRNWIHKFKKWRYKRKLQKLPLSTRLIVAELRRYNRKGRYYD